MLGDEEAVDLSQGGLAQAVEDELELNPPVGRHEVPLALGSRTPVTAWATSEESVCSLVRA